MIKLLGSNNDESVENVPHLKITEAVLLYYNIVRQRWLSTRFKNLEYIC